MSENNSKPVNINVFLNELTQILFVLRSTISNLIKENPDLEVRSYRSEWHIRGLVYHCQNIIKHYNDIGEGLITRVNAISDTKPDVLIMSTLSCQYLMYDFYALINLAKITLDNFVKLINPLFITKNIPKSISDIKSGTTNCPMYERHSNDNLTKYLIDLRNCLIHYKSFATRDNVYVIREGVDTIEEAVDSEEIRNFVGSMLRAVYRITEKGEVVFNVYIPDKIFEIKEDGTKRIAEFSYDMKRNIVGYSMKFIRIIMFSMLEIITYYKDKTKRFIYNKHGVEEKVKYIDFIW